MEPPSPSTWPKYAEMTQEYKDALPNTQLPDLTIGFAAICEQLSFKRTEPVPGISEREISVENSSKTANLRCLIYWPTDNKEKIPVYVLFHPGGWYMGDPEVEERNARTIAKEHNVVVFAPTYRLAPEHPSPAGVDDVWDWTLWIAHHAAEQGINADPTKGYILAGESPGGNMALVAALKARDSPAELKGISVTGVHCRSSQLCAPDAIPEEYKKYYKSYEQCRDAPVFNRGVQNCTEEYLKPDHSSFLFSPIAHSKGLGGLPPVFFTTAGNDPSRDDNLIAEKMMRDKYGVKTRLNLYQGASHLFWFNFPDLEITKQWAKDTRDGVNWLLAGGN